jgi:hypothetical protein
MHRHGSYQRYQQPKGGELFAMERYLCLPCGHTVSVLPANRLPYRPLEVDRLQGGFDAQAKVGTGLDPPPEPIEAGCLQRAWQRFLTRVNLLQDALGQILPAELHTAQQLWRALRRGVGSAEAMLRLLARACKRSLLGDYACLRPAP